MRGLRARCRRLSADGGGAGAARAIVAVWIGLMAYAPGASGQDSGAARSLRAAEEGGTIIVCRHAITDSFSEREPVDYDDPSTQRRLDERGEEQSRRIGAAITARGIRIGDLVASPMDRARRTAELMFDTPPRIDSIWHTNGSDYGGPALERRRAFLATPVADGNALVVSHIGTMESVIRDIPGAVGEGDCVVVRPLGEGHEVVGVVRAEEWGEGGLEDRLSLRPPGRHDPSESFDASTQEPPMHPLERFRLAAFEEAAAVDDGSAPATELRQALESLVMERLLSEGLPGVEALVEELNGLGHAFAPRPSSPGWSSWSQSTNGGARVFYIHVEPGELSSVMLLYDETLEATVERRRAHLGSEERARQERIESFYGRALALVDRDYAELSELDRMVTCLHALEAGVNNGGFATYLANTDGAQLVEATALLARIGANELAAIVGGVTELLAPLGAATTEGLSAALETWAEELSSFDERFVDADESIPLLVLDYLEAGAASGPPTSTR